MKINISQNDIHIDLIELLLQNRKIHYNSSNDLFLFEFAKELQIQSIEDMAENWEIYELQKVEEIIFNINDINIDKYQKKLVKKTNLVGKETICRMIINACIARPSKTHIYQQLIQFLQIESVFSRILLNTMKFLHGAISVREEKSQTICFLARHMHDRGFIKMSQIPDIWPCAPPFFADSSDRLCAAAEEERLAYRMLAADGVNPGPVAAMLRADDIDSFQKVACNPAFDMNQKVKPSEFEKCDFINNRPCSLLEYSAFFGALRCFKYILLDEGTAHSAELMKYAIAGGSAEIVHICEQLGDASFKDARELAIKFHRWDIFEWLCDSKCQDDLQSEDFYSFANQCIRFSNFGTLSYLLLAKEVDLNFALLTAIENDNLLLAKWLIKHKEKLDRRALAKQKIGFLHYATRNENIDILQLLLAQREFSNVNAKYKGKPPAFLAIETENYDVYKFLIAQKEVDFDARDFSGKQLIHVACEHRSVLILSDLLDNYSGRIDINSLDKNGDTPLHLACENGNVEIIEALLGRCRQAARLSAKDKKGKTPTMVGCLSKRVKRRLDVVRAVYNFAGEGERAGIINCQGPLKKSLLHMACENKEIEVVRFLLSLPETDVNALDIDNRTALMTSVFFGFDDIALLLLGHASIDVAVHDKNDRTAYDIAAGRSLDDKLILSRLQCSKSHDG